MSITTVIGRVFLLLLVGYFSFILLTTNPPWIFVDNANLLIHEGGHLIFRPFGEFIYILGGSLTQILVPCLFFGYFLRKKDFFSSSVMLFWMGDNIINVSAYMKDAIPMVLPLLGGDGAIHDWHWLFTSLGILPSSIIIGQSFFVLGALCLVLSIVGMIYFTVVKIRESNEMRFH